MKFKDGDKVKPIFPPIIQYLEKHSLDKNFIIKSHASSQLFVRVEFNTHNGIEDYLHPIEDVGFYWKKVGFEREDVKFKLP